MDIQLTNSPGRHAVRVAFCGTRGIPARYGGFETAADEISRRFVDAGYTCDVFCRFRGNGPPQTSHEGRDLIYVRGSASRKLDTFLSSIQTGRYLLQHRTRYSHVFWFNNANLPGILLTALARIPMTVNTDGVEWRRAKWSLPFKAYYYLASVLVSIVCPSLVSDSRGVQELYRRRFLKETSYIPYGTASPPAISQEEQRRILESLGLTPGRYFLQITRFEPDNLPLDVAAAFSKAGLEEKGFTMASVGYKEATPYANRLLALDGRAGVRVLNATYDPVKLHALRANCRCYVHGNCVGGTNPALLEAMAACPRVIAANNEFNREVLGPDGILFDKENIEPALRAAAESASQADALKARVDQAYQWDAVADSYMRVCEGRPPAYSPTPHHRAV